MRSQYIGKTKAAFLYIAAAALTAAAALLFPPCPATAYASYRADVVMGIRESADEIDVSTTGFYKTESNNGHAKHLRTIAYNASNPCLSGRFQMRLGANSEILALMPHYDVPKEEIAGRTADYKRKVRRIVDSIPQRYNDIERLLYLQDVLTDICEYNHDIENDLDKDSYELYNAHSSADSALLDGSSICLGYSTALADLFHAAGYDAEIETDEEHAWVVVELYGERLRCDATNDDAQDTHRHFLNTENGDVPYADRIPEKRIAGWGSVLAKSFMRSANETMYSQWTGEEESFWRAGLELS